MIYFSPLNSAYISVSGSVEFSSTVNYDVNYKPDENPSDNPCAEFSNMPIGGYSFNITQIQSSSLTFGGTRSYPVNSYCDPEVNAVGFTTCPASFRSPFGVDCAGGCSEGGVYTVYINDDQVTKSATNSCTTSVTGEDGDSNCAQYIADTEYGCPGSNFPRPGEDGNELNFTLSGGCIAADVNGVISYGEDSFEGFIPYKYYAIYNVNANPGVWGLPNDEEANTTVSGSNILASKGYPGIAVFVMDLSSLPGTILVNSSNSYTFNDIVETDATVRDVNFSGSYNVSVQIDFS
jgi:hypothetical protein